MIENKIAADARIEHTAATPAIHVDKYTNNSRGFHQKRVLSLLQRGEELSAADITVALHVSDPRSHIRDLRAKGVPIADVWCDSEHGGRFKRYFIRQDNTGKEAQR